MRYLSQSLLSRFASTKTCKNLETLSSCGQLKLINDVLHSLNQLMKYALRHNLTNNQFKDIRLDVFEITSCLIAIKDSKLN